MKRMSTADLIALILVIIGGINWGLVGAFDYNLVDSLFGMGSAISKVIYILVGLAALYMLYPLFAGAKKEAKEA
jgi:uncharacterized protein